VRITINAAEAKLAWQVTKRNETFVVTGHRIEKFARRTNFDQFQAVNRLRDIMKKMGITYELKRQGADGTSIIQIGDASFPLVEQ